MSKVGSARAIVDALIDAVIHRMVSDAAARHANLCNTPMNIAVARDAEDVATRSREAAVAELLERMPLYESQKVDAEDARSSG